MEASDYQLRRTFQVDGDAMAIDGGNVYVTSDGSVIKFTSGGKQLTSWSDQVGGRR